jgi:hypothetical protein
MRRGQSMLELVFVVLFAILACAAMAPYVGRSAKASIKQLENHINVEACSDGAVC